jgi:hypothetical protein
MVIGSKHRVVMWNYFVWNTGVFYASEPKVISFYSMLVLRGKVDGLFKNLNRIN